MTPAQELCEQAYRDFDAWVEEHDPYGEMDLIEQCWAYGEWFNTHGS